MECLGSLEHEGADVIVIDNNSSDGSQAALRKWEDLDVGRTLIENSKNLGFAKANNQGLKRARTVYVMLLNSDTKLTPGTLGRLIEWMDKHPETGACGPRLIYPDGTRQPSPSPVPTPWMYVVRFLGLKYLIPGNRLKVGIGKVLGPVLGNTVSSHMNPGVTRNNDDCEGFLSGAALFVRNEVVEEIGGLDEGYFMYLEDVDWCIRIREAGWKLGFVPTIDVLHYAGASFERSRVRKSFRAASSESYKSIMRYLGRYSTPGGRLVVRTVISVSLFTQSLFVVPILAFRRRNEAWAYLRQNFSNIVVVWKSNSRDGVGVK
jgi:GT2 family glycosyltransferase